MASKQPASLLKNKLHPRNKHRFGYNFKELTNVYPELKRHLLINKFQTESIDFSNSDAVKALNKSLLLTFYGVTNWEIPDGYLCPSIPGRADYIHYLADLLALNNDGIIPTGKLINVLDIGSGANCVYPIIGTSEYQWQFTGSDTDLKAISAAKKITAINKNLSAVQLRLQTDKSIIFNGIIKPDEEFDLTMCNPPFHASKEEADAGTQKKWNKLGLSIHETGKLNFGGKNNELWTPGGEKSFILRMIGESETIRKQCLYFTTLVSKNANLPVFYNALNYLKAADVKTIKMSQGQKESRILAWSFLDQTERNAWKQRRWK